MRLIGITRAGRVLSTGFAATKGLKSTAIRWNSTGPRILFCGSDQFSVESLKAVNELRRKAPSAASSLDVVVKKGKPAGRGRKSIRDGTACPLNTQPQHADDLSVPLKEAANSLSLPCHEISTFTGWQPPPVDLVIAVSFGLFVPKRILGAATYGGMNLHPSLLPE